MEVELYGETSNRSTSSWVVKPLRWGVARWRKYPCCGAGFEKSTRYISLRRYCLSLIQQSLVENGFMLHQIKVGEMNGKPNCTSPTCIINEFNELNTAALLPACVHM